MKGIYFFADIARQINWDALVTQLSFWFVLLPVVRFKFM